MLSGHDNIISSLSNFSVKNNVGHFFSLNIDGRWLSYCQFHPFSFDTSQFQSSAVYSTGFTDVKFSLETVITIVGF